MSRKKNLCDFQIGYEYVRKHYSFLAKYTFQNLWELGNAFLQTRGASAELSRGMGFFFLELGIKMRLAEITAGHKKEDCV